MIDLETLEVNVVLLTSEKKCPQWDLMLIVFQRHQVAAACWALTQSQRQRGFPPPWCLAPVGPLGCPWRGLCCETPCRWSFLPLCLMCCSRWGSAGGQVSRPAKRREMHIEKICIIVGTFTMNGMYESLIPRSRQAARISARSLTNWVISTYSWLYSPTKPLNGVSILSI